jgi:hypothetical protein
MGRSLIRWGEFRGGQGKRRNGRHTADSFEQDFTRVAGEDGSENAERQKGKQEAEDQPTNEEFPGAIRIEAKAEDQEGELRRKKPFTQVRRKTNERDRHEMGGTFPCEKKKDGEMTDTGRPAQTGQYRSVPPSRCILVGAGKVRCSLLDS